MRLVLTSVGISGETHHCVTCEAHLGVLFCIMAEDGHTSLLKLSGTLIAGLPFPPELS